MVRFAIGIGCLLLLCGLIIGALVFAPLAAAQDASLTPPPSSTATATATASLTASATPSETPSLTPNVTFTETPTLTATTTAPATLTATWTPVVQTVIVPQPPIVITVAVPIPIVPSLPAILPPPAPTNPPPPPPALPDASPTPAFGWTRIESGALIPMIGSWGIVRHAQASAGAFRESGSANARLRFPFTGDGIRILLVTHPHGGTFAVELDGQHMGIVNTIFDEVVVSQTGPYFFQPGYHVLDLIALAPQSGDTSIRIDAVEVFQGPPLPTLEATPEVAAQATAPPTSGEVLAVALLSQPPTPLPTPTPSEAALLIVDVIVAYDLNRNGAPEPAEGVERLSVRLVDTSTNRLLASGLTDAVGFVRLQAMTSAPVTALIPFLGEAFDVRSSPRGGSTRWTLLLDAGVQPGLIP